MARLLEQLSLIQCPKDGEYTWRYTSTVHSVTTKTDEIKEQVSFCAKCQPKVYFQMLKNADKVIPLTKYNQRGDARENP
jgi:hypothetical protein